MNSAAPLVLPTAVLSMCKSICATNIRNFDRHHTHVEPLKGFASLLFSISSDNTIDGSRSRLTFAGDK